MLAIKRDGSIKETDLLSTKLVKGLKQYFQLAYLKFFRYRGRILRRVCWIHIYCTLSLWEENRILHLNWTSQSVQSYGDKSGRFIQWLNVGVPRVTESSERTCDFSFCEVHVLSCGLCFTHASWSSNGPLIHYFGCECHSNAGLVSCLLLAWKLSGMVIYSWSQKGI